MKRPWMALAASGALLSSCGPDDRPQQPCASKPDFVLTVRAEQGLLPDDTLISVKFGGDGHETYSPSGHNARQILFCEPTYAPPGGNAGAGGATSSENHAFGGADDAGAAVATIAAIGCELWTGGPAWVTVSAYDLETSQALAPKDDVCTSWYDISLGADDTEP